MDASQFDALARSIVQGSSRRGLLRALAGGALGLDLAFLPRAAAAKKNKKAIPNQFGCLNVGQKCRGNSALCCSGVCIGKKPKKGKPDKRKCVAHNTGGCSPERSVCVTSAPVLSLCDPPNVPVYCFATTGNAGFCGSALGFDPAIHCQPCTKDTDCLPLGFAPGSACVFFQGGECSDPCAATDGRACFPPAVPE